MPNTSTTYPRSQASTPGTLPSIGGGRGASGAPDVNGSPPGGARGGDLHTDGSAERPRGDCNSQVRQQLVTIGFPLEDITRVQARLRSAGRCRFMHEKLTGRKTYLLGVWKLVGGERERDRDRDRQAGRQTGRQTDRDRDTQTHRQTDRDRQTDKQTETHRHTEHGSYFFLHPPPPPRPLPLPLPAPTSKNVC